MVGPAGVGHVAIPLAAALDAKVFATASAGSRAIAIRMGAADAIDYRAESVEAYVKRLTSGEGFDVVFDPIGGQHLADSFQAARNGGQVATMALTQIDLRPMHLKGLSLHVIFMLLLLLTGKWPRWPTRANFTRSSTKHASLTTAAAAYRHLESGEATGKVVIDISDNSK
jgi:NADPH2:quinone reductase